MGARFPTDPVHNPDNGAHPSDFSSVSLFQRVARTVLTALNANRPSMIPKIPTHVNFEPIVLLLEESDTAVLFGGHLQVMPSSEFERLAKSL